MKKLILVVVVLVAVGAGAGAYYMRRGAPEPVVNTAAITRGDIVDTVQSTGTLEAVETVDVGTQVSGVVQELYADFNSIVKQGQVIARLDPSIIQTQIEQARANVIRSEADLERLKVTLADSKQKLVRAEELSAKKLIAQTELEAAALTVRTAEAQIRSSEAGLTQAKSQLNTQEVNLGHTVIKAPIDGIVIARTVDQGQTVAASQSAPTLYILAADLTKMQVLANIDESDVGRMRPGQAVTFRVDAYPTNVFSGTVQQVRLQPTTVQNVVTYQTVISVLNPELKLKPGMTATVSIEVARKDNVLRVPSSALRFRPTADIFAALHLPEPDEPQRRVAEGDGPSADRGGAPSTTPEERQRRMQERLAAMTPEAREQFEQRMRERGQGERSGRRQDRTGAQPVVSALRGDATTIDALFAPLPQVETPGRVWLWMNNELKPINVRLGISDGTYTELIGGSGLQEGTEIVSNVATGLEPAARPGQNTGGGGQNPLMPRQRGRGGRGR